MSSPADFAAPLLDLVPDVVFLYDDEGRYRYANRAAARLLGREAEEIVGATHEELFPDGTARRIRRRQREALSGGEPVRAVYPFTFPSGETRIFEGTMTPVEEAEFGFRGVVGVVRDVTDRERARRAVARAKRKYEAVFDVNPIAVAVIDYDAGWVLDVNRGFEDLYGYRPEEIEGRSVFELEIFLDAERIARIRERVLAEGEVRRELMQIRRADGAVRDVLFSCVRVSVDGELYLVGASEDVSPLKESERELRHRALHDALTGLPNPDLFRDRCLQALARAERRQTGFAVGYVDLDGFKAINDERGHRAGDRVLEELARRMERRLRGEETIARLGGDEFAVVWEDVGNLDEARAAAERFHGAFDEPVPLDGATLPVRASCGVVVVEPAPDRDRAPSEDRLSRVEEILHRADSVMYAVKEAGGDGCRVVPGR